MTGAMVAASREVLARHARSFRIASWFLPSDCRDDAAVLYAFCRHVDDLADEAPDPAQAAAALSTVRAQVIGSAPAEPLVAATLEVLVRARCGKQPVLDLLEGVASDLGRVRVADDPELIGYSYRVAGTVGLMMCGPLGVRDRRGLDHAVALGVAMQLTNICRDVLEDAGRDRVYLPDSRLRRAGVAGEEIVTGTAQSEAVAEVVRELLDRADRYYAIADRGMKYIPARARLGVFVASRLYQEIGNALRARGADALRGRVWTGPVRKTIAMARAIGAWIGSLVAPRAVGVLRSADA